MADEDLAGKGLTLLSLGRNESQLSTVPLRLSDSTDSFQIRNTIRGAAAISNVDVDNIFERFMKARGCHCRHKHSCVSNATWGFL